MSRTIYFAVFLGLSLCMMNSAEANDASAAIEQIAEAIERTNESDCKDEAALKCLGISESACRAAKTDVMEACTLPLLKKMVSGDVDELADVETKMARCAYDIAVDKHNIDPAKYQRCVALESNDASDAIMQLLRKR